MKISYNVSLREWNTFGMEVQAAAWLEYDSAAELAGLLADYRFASELPLPLLHIGRGSNLLFTGDFPGTVLHSRIRFIERLPDRPSDSGAEGPAGDPGVLVRVGAGVVWDEFCAWAAAEGLWGPENLSLIPGETGSAAVQNIGAYGREVCQLVDTVECFDTLRHAPVRLKGEECGYGYRRSRFKEEWKGRYIVTAVTFRLTGSYRPALDYGHVREALASAFGPEPYTPQQVRDTVIAIRRDKLPDPAQTGNAGSFFRNPFVLPEQYQRVARLAEEQQLGPVPHFLAEDGLVKIPAAWLIDKCGWKGRRLGNAGVWAGQPLVLVNATGAASPADILALEQEIVASVRQRFGVTLHPEVEHI